jgi:hypothetical protein
MWLLDTVEGVVAIHDGVLDAALSTILPAFGMMFHVRKAKHFIPKMQ